jgi:hypothetical protein
MATAAQNQNPNHISRAELARLIGAKSASYIHELEKTGRAHRAPDGKHWLKAESLQAYMATRDPAKQGVAAHWAAKRAAKAGPAVAPADPEAAPEEQAGQPEAADPDSTALFTRGEYDFQSAKAKREHWAAEREHALYKKESGELMDRGEVVASYAQAGATLRSKLEGWQSSLAPQLVGLDESSIRTLIADQVERALTDLVDTFARMAAEAQ